LGLSFNADGSRLFSFDAKGAVKEWAVQPAAAPPDEFVVTSPTGDRQVIYHPRSAAREGSSEISVRDAAGKEVLRFREHTGAVRVAYFSPDGRYVVSQAEGVELKLWDIATGEVRLSQALAGEREAVLYLDHELITFSGDGRWVAVPEPGGGASVRDLTHLREVFRSPQEDAYCRLSFDGLRAVSVRFPAVAPQEKKGQVENRLRLWDVTSGKVLLTVLNREGDYALSPDGKLLGACVREGNDSGRSQDLRQGFAGQVVFWRTDTGEKALTLPNVIVPGQLWFSPDGKLLAVHAIVESQIVLWDLTTAKVLYRLQGHAQFLTDVAFSPDGKRVASLDPLAEVKLWDTRTGNELLNLPLEKGPVLLQRLSFSRDGTRLTAKSLSGMGFGIPPFVGQQTWDATPRPGEGVREGNASR
jgi:WD40 repeat protein